MLEVSREAAVNRDDLLVVIQRALGDRLPVAATALRDQLWGSGWRRVEGVPGEHLFLLSPDGVHVQHPWPCRDKALSCPVQLWALSDDLDRYDHGLYRFLEDGSWRLSRIEAPA